MFQFDCQKLGWEEIGKRIEANSEKGLETISNLIFLFQNYLSGFSKYANEFTIPYLLATVYFTGVEQKRLLDKSPLENLQSYLELLKFNQEIFNRGFQSSLEAISSYNQYEMENAMTATLNTCFPFLKKDGENLEGFISRQADLVTMLSDGYPKAIEEIEPEYGFHFERGHHELVAETDRFFLYQVAPISDEIKIDIDKKPLLIIPPFVLGANILAFLPHEQRSYAHCFANMRIPTYIRIMKDIEIGRASCRERVCHRV